MLQRSRVEPSNLHSRRLPCACHEAQRRRPARRCPMAGAVDQLSNVEQRRKQFWINAVCFKRRPVRQNRNCIMAVQAFLMAGDHPEIPDTGVGLQLLTKQPRGVFDKDRVGRVQLCKGLFVLAFHHHLRFGRHGAAAGINQIFEPQKPLPLCDHRRYPRHRALGMRRCKLPSRGARMLAQFQRTGAGAGIDVIRSACRPP